MRPVLAGHRAVGTPVDVVGGDGQARQSAGDERLAQAVRGERQVGDRAEPAEALPEHAPGRAAGQVAPDELGVQHDAVGPEVGQVIGLGLGRAQARQRLPGGGGGPAGAALVEQQDPVVVQRPVQPGVPALRPLRPEAGPALQEQQPGQVGVGPVGGDDLAGEHLDLLSVRPAMIQRDGEQVVGQHGAGLAVALTRSTLPASRGPPGPPGRVGAMAGGIKTVSVAERRARLAVRHHLAPASGPVPWPRRWRRHRSRCTAPIPRRCTCLPGPVPTRRQSGNRARAVRGALADADARHAPDGVRRARCSRAGHPVSLYRPDRRAAAPPAHPGRRGSGYRPGRRDLAQGRGRGHGPGTGRARLGNRRGTGQGRTAAAHADHRRGGQPLRRGGEPDQPAAHVAVRRGTDRAWPPARRVDLHPVHLVRCSGTNGPAGRRRPGRTGPAVAGRVRPGPAVRPAVVDRLDRGPGPAGGELAGPHRGGPRRHARRAAGRR